MHRPHWSPEGVAFSLRLLLSLLPFYIPLLLARSLSPNVIIGLLWAMVPAVLLGSPCLGHLSKLTLGGVGGSLFGATLAMAMNLSGSVAAKLVVMALVVGFYPYVDAVLLPGGVTGKLCAANYLIVIGQCLCGTETVAVMYFYGTIVVGYLAGTASCLFVGSAFLPYYASDKAVSEMKGGIRALQELHDAAWAAHSVDHFQMDREESMKEAFKRCEEARDSIAASLHATEDQLAFSQEETPVGKLGGRNFYLPTWVWMIFITLQRFCQGRFKDAYEGKILHGIPKKETADFMASFLKMSRAVWAHHLALRDSLDVDLEELGQLKAQYPQGLLDSIRLSMKAFLQDLCDAFPDAEDERSLGQKSPSVSYLNLKVFERNVNKLLQISRDEYEVMVLPFLSSTDTTEVRSSFNVEAAKKRKITYPVFFHWSGARHAMHVMLSEALHLKSTANDLIQKLADRAESKEAPLETPEDIVPQICIAIDGASPPRTSDERSARAGSGSEGSKAAHVGLPSDAAAAGGDSEEATASGKEEGKRSLVTRCLDFMVEKYRDRHPSVNDGIRVAVLEVLIMAPLLALSDEIQASRFGKGIYYALLWTAITCAFVNATFIGKAANTGVQRAAGTIIGSSLAFGTMATGRPELQVLIGLAVFPITIYIGTYMAKADYAGKLTVLTFLIIISFPAPSLDAVLETYVLRVTGILAGVLLSYAASIFIFPRSATCEVLSQLHVMIKATSDLHQCSWDLHQISHLSDSPSFGSIQEALRLKAEEAHSAYLKSLKTFTLNMAVANEESFLGEIFGLRVFAPRWLLLGTHRPLISKRRIKSFVTALGHLRQSVAALNLALAEGFGSEATDIIRRRYSSGLLEAIQHLCSAFLQDLLNAFPADGFLRSPGHKIIPSIHLDKLGHCLSVMSSLSDRQFQRLHPSSPTAAEGDEEDMAAVLLAAGSRPLLSAYSEGAGMVRATSANPWLSRDSLPEPHTVPIPTQTLTKILLPHTSDGFLILLRWVSARLALMNFHEEGVKALKAANALVPVLSRIS